MNTQLTLGISLVFGSALGWAHGRALWAAVRHLAGRSRAGPWWLLQPAARLLLLLAGFALVASWGGWRALLGAFAGFQLARVVLLRRMRAPMRQPRSRP